MRKASYKVNHAEKTDIYLGIIDDKNFIELFKRIDFIKAKYFDAYIKYKGKISQHNQICKYFDGLKINRELDTIRPFSLEQFAYYYQLNCTYTCYTQTSLNTNICIYKEELGFNPYVQYEDLEKIKLHEVPDYTARMNGDFLSESISPIRQKYLSNWNEEKERESKAIFTNETNKQNKNTNFQKSQEN